MKIMLFVLVIASIGIPMAHAQTIEVIEGIELETSQVIAILGIGVLAGVIRSLINWTNSEITTRKEGIRNITACILATIPLSFTAAMGLQLNLLGYIVVFFAAYGGGAALQNINIKKS